MLKYRLIPIKDLASVVAKVCCLVLAALLVVPFALAEEKGGEEKERPFEVFAGYSMVREDSHNLNGWTGTVIGNVNHWFGIAADFDGHYGSHKDGTETVKVREHGFTFGPHVAFHNHSKVTPFAFALAGGLHKSETTGAIAASATGFAANFGGGLDIGINENISIRLIQVDAAYARFDGKGSTSPRFSAGLIFHLGAPK